MGFRFIPIWFDLWIQDCVFGFGILSLETEEESRNLFSICYCEGSVLVDLFWLRLVDFVLWDNEDDL